MTWDNVRQSRQRLSLESGAMVKDWGGKLPIALVYPNSYYIGMSNLGIQAIYNLLNGHPDIVCERMFYENDKLPPLSVESQRPLSDFAVIAFSVSYELDYFNIAPILRASNIPVFTADRDDSHPLVIAGGPCIIVNPMPLAPLFDCLCIGEAEVIMPPLLSVLTEGTEDRRSELLKALSRLPGIFVPQYPPEKPVSRQWQKNLDDFLVHSVVLTPDTELGDLFLIEVQRGCKWGCQFCMVSNAFRPLRFHSLESLVYQAEAGLKFRKRIGLVGPSVTDHPRFEELLARLKQMGAELSVSSLRIKPLSTPVLKALASSGATTVALAPEAGSQRLRDSIHKGINEDDILAAIREVGQQGIKQLKLYFMVGLPGETEEDIEEMVDLTQRCKAIFDAQQPGSRILLSVAPFVPKAGTPCELATMEKLSTLNQRISRLKGQLESKGIKVNPDSPAWSEVQAVLARGDARLAAVLASIEVPSLAAWRNAMKQHGLDIDYYARGKWDAKSDLPWEIIDSRVR